jgi:feruloyl-CoA synthase
MQDTIRDIRNVPFRKVGFMPREIDAERRGDGTIVLRARQPLQAYEPHIPSYLRRWAAERPDHIWLAQRRGPERQWLKVTYAQARRTVDALTQALLDMGLDETKPVMAISGNSIEHALLMMAAMQARVPFSPISPAYGLMSQDFAKLKYMFELLQPGLVLAQNGKQFARALAALPLGKTRVVHVDEAPAGIASTAYAELAATKPTDAVERSIARIEPKTIGKLLFTSGSTGMPKAVVNTQEMMCANLAMGRQCIPRDPDEPPSVTLQWLPWSHTMGGNAGLHGVLADGGAHYIDDGRPLPGQFEETLKNLREIPVTGYGNVPAGYAALAAVLEKDDAMAALFFKNLKMLAYGGAALPDDLYTRMQALAVKHTGNRIVFFTGFGATETAPTATSTYWETERVGLIGLPHPGVELKLVPFGGGQKYELRVRSVIVTPGYYKRPDLTAAAFDEEGFYKIGDAAEMVDPDDPSAGLIFAGRVVEDFKLMSGTFVQVGSLRVAAIAAASPVLQDAVVTGQDKAYVGLIAWPNLLACRQLCGKPEASLADVVKEPAVIARLKAGLAAHNKQNPGSSTQVRRVVLLVEPPSIDGNELTDKGYINQRATLERRAAFVDKLYAEPPGEGVVVIGGSGG